jgi:CRP-like cAMP-binding protein
LHYESTAFVTDPEVVQTLRKRSIPIPCDTDCILFRQGDAPVALYILEEGEVTLTMSSPQGKPIMSFETAAGSLLGLPGLIGDQPYSLTATAHAGARVFYIPRDDFKALMQADPSLSLKILQVLAAEVRSARAHYMDACLDCPAGAPGNQCE